MPYRMLGAFASSGNLSVEVPVTRVPKLNLKRSAYMDRLLAPMPTIGTLRAEATAVWTGVEIGLGQASSDAPQARAEVEDMVKKMLAIKNDFDTAAELLRKNLGKFRFVREAFLIDSPDGVCLWAFVEEPFMLNQRRVIEETASASRAFEELWIDCRVLPASSLSEAHRSANAVTIVAGRG